MKNNYRRLVEKSKEKVISAVNLVEASLSNLKEYDENKKYNPKELEPYDALSDRFIRAVKPVLNSLRLMNIT